VLTAWWEMQGDARKRIAEIERKQKAIREEPDRLDQAFLFERSNRHVRPPPKQSARGTHACAGPRADLLGRGNSTAFGPFKMSVARLPAHG